MIQLAPAEIGAKRQAAARNPLPSGLKESEDCFRSITEDSPVAMLIQRDGIILYVNRKLLALLGAAQINDVVGHPTLDFVHPDSRALVGSRIERMRTNGGQIESAGIRMLTFEGGAVDIETSGTAIQYDGQRCTCSMLLDVTARRVAENRLKLLAGVFDNAREGIMLTHIDGAIVDVNPRFCEITGYTREEAVGQNPSIISSGRHDAVFYSSMWATIKRDGHWHGEIWNRRKNGEVYPELLSISILKGVDSSADHYLAVFTDISDLKAHEARLEHLAHYDALTQLPNRVLLADRLGVAMLQTRRNGRLLAVCYLDLDGFKPINDQYGHQFGDRLLIQVAQRLAQSLRGGDSVARIGGDEFVLLLGDLESTTECDLVLSRLLRSIAEPTVLDGVAVYISASVGVALFPDDDADVDTLLRHADQALYAAKEAGRNRYHLFDTSHDQGLRARREGLAQFAVALAAGQLCLHYQPKVDMRRGRVIGAEALIRWQHPESGLLMPAQFLGVIENGPADVALGEWVIQEALRQISAWRDAGLEVVVSVNISAYHLARDDFVFRLKAFLAPYPGLPSHCLEIELLETAALEDISHITSLMAECQALGVDFALDDFGTGYSSLTYFKRLPAGTLKIDQSFIRDMLNDGDDLAIVQGIIGLTKTFRRRVIAEGVETVEHGVMLLQMGCDLAQGYGIARPMPAEDFPRWVAEWRPDDAWVMSASMACAPEDMGLIMAEQDQRRWLDDLKFFLLATASEERKPPPQATTLCRFGQWYESDGAQRFSHMPRFTQIEPLHEKLHAVGRELVALHGQGQRNEAQSRIPELEAASDELVGGLHALLIAITMAPMAAD
jgi:diguanylate cyclase (GGDEF)-like protein/PAS domain S-box-containing protein